MKVQVILILKMNSPIGSLELGNNNDAKTEGIIESLSDYKIRIVFIETLDKRN